MQFFSGSQVTLNDTLMMNICHHTFVHTHRFYTILREWILINYGLLAQLVKNSPECRRPGFNPWVGKIPWRKERLLTPAFWPREFHGLYSPWGRKESDMTERLSLWSFLMAQLVKNPPAMWEIWVWFLGWEDPLEKGMAIYSSILAWRIPWTVYYLSRILNM